MMRSRAPTLPEYRVRNDYEKTRKPRRHVWSSALSDPRIIFAIKVSAGILLFALLWFLYNWETHIEIMFYARSWVRQEITPIEPLAGCFSEERIRADGSLYNITKARAPKQYEVHAGVQMRLGMDCYDFSGTIPSPDIASRPSSPLPAAQRTNFHTYWRADLISFGERQEWMIKSFLATQDLMSSRLILWTNGLSLANHPRVAGYLRKHPGAFEVRLVDVVSMAKGTQMEDSVRLKSSDSKAWVDGDLIRLLVIWVYGGVWVDMDSLLTRDLKPLLEHEFVSEWDCYNKLYQPMNGALMHFFQHSPYLCEAFHIMKTSQPPRPGSTDWGSHLYYKLWRRLIAASVPPFKVLPYCFAEGRSCRMDNRLPDPFAKDSRTWGKGLSLQEDGDLDKVLQKIFVVHLHNQWAKSFPKNGWVDRLLLRRYSATQK